MDTIKLVLAGCGQMGGRWLDYALQRKDAEPVALVDVAPASAAAMNDRFGLKLPVYSTVEEAIRETRAVLLLDTTIPDAHASNACVAMEMGAGVMMEKPMATTMVDAQRLIDISKRTGAFCAVMQNRRFTKEIRSLKAMLDEGIIGKPGYVAADFFLGPRFGGFRETMEHPLILDMAIHTFDAARYLIDARPTAVYCHEFNPEGSWYRGASSAACFFEFENGAAFSYNGSWSAQGFPTSWEGSWRLSGSKGTAIWDGDNMPHFQTANEGAGGGLASINGDLRWSGAERRDACLDEMFDSYRNGTRSETDIHDNIHSVAMMLGAIESSRRGARVKLSELYSM
ncbi:Gfo/Idh/MocA family protein [Paenibacillus sp. LPE1-1-1.1]|uniref:Gfo/Idh/MocA family protein n=1 Tax=Paenibacillus sp. LPE1-1-1.1 TaxID=3135230 RepID=UPI00342907F8